MRVFEVLLPFLVAAIPSHAAPIQEIDDDAELAAIAVDQTSFDNIPYIELEPVRDHHATRKRADEALELKNDVLLEWRSGKAFPLSFQYLPVAREALTGWLCS